MRNRMICAAMIGATFVLSATALLAQSSDQLTPLNMNTGEWQTTMTVNYTGLPPQYASAMNHTTTYKTCVKPENLQSGTWSKKMIGKCSSVTVLKSTANDADVEASGCDAGNGMTAGGRGTFHLDGSGHLTGTMNVTFTGATPFGQNGPIHMNAHYDSNWMAASCPAHM